MKNNQKEKKKTRNVSVNQNNNDKNRNSTVYKQNRKKKSNVKRKKNEKRKLKKRKKCFQNIKTIEGRKKLITILKQKETIVLFVMFFILLLFFVNFGRHKVDGQSMEPTFHSNDRIILSKYAKPSRYAIITFEPTYEKGSSYVKRIIGMPGDKIMVNKTKLYILPRENEGEKKFDLTQGDLDGTIIVNLSEQVAKELKEYERIPENQFFVQGDNRLHSDDSRVFGLINKKQIEGVVVYRYYPFMKMGTVH